MSDSLLNAVLAEAQLRSLRYASHSHRKTPRRHAKPARCAGPVLGGAFAFPCETYSSFPLCGPGQLFSKRCAPYKKLIVCLLQPLMPAFTSLPGLMMLMACEAHIDKLT
jgi:hypothetical protein